MEKILVFLLVLSMTLVCFGKKLKRIEKIIARIEARQDADSLTRREDFSDLSQRLNHVENWLNSSGMTSEMEEGGANPGSIVSEVDRSLVDDMQRVKSAFADEKARWRRQAADMEHSIRAVQHDVSSEMQSLVKTVKNELVTEVSKMMTDLKQEIVSEMQISMKTVNDELVSGVSKIMKDFKNEMASVKDVENVIETLDALQSSIQDTPIKCSMPAVILDKLDKIENMTGYSSCLELYRSGERVSGAYDIVLASNSAPIRVYCDMETDGGGWTVFQRRQDGSEDFFRGWDDYAAGFGDVEGEFWLGNDYISEMTRQCCHELRVDLEGFEGKSAYAKYGRFKVFPRGDDYKLDVGDYSGDAGDSLTYHSGFGFSTKDKDNDEWSYNSCAQDRNGAWWYKQCDYSNLNGLYLESGISSSEGIQWYHWKNKTLKKTEMKFRKL